MPNELKLFNLKETPREELVKEYANVFEQYNVPKEKQPLMAHVLQLQLKEMKDRMEHLSEKNVTGDVSTYDKLLIPMIVRGYMNVIANELFGVWPMAADTGKFFYMTNHYTNDATNSVKPAVGQILVIDATGLAAIQALTAGGVGQPISDDDGVTAGTVRYVEATTSSIFVEITAGTAFGAGGFDDTGTYAADAGQIVRTFTTEQGMHVFDNYSTFASIALGEAAGNNIKEVELKVDSANVTAESHKIKSRYTWELLRRLKDYHKIEGEKVIDGIGAQSFAQELNRRSLVEIKTACTTGGQSTFNYTSADGLWELQKYKNMIAAINRKSAEILQANHIGLGNYLIIDPKTWASLDSYGYIDTSMLAGKMADPMVNPFVGVLLNRYRVYVNPWEYDTVICMGYKDFSGAPDSETKAGKFFCPYIPIDIKQTMEQETGQPVKFFWSMYAFADHPLAATSGSNDFFRRINVTNLPT
jgi:hypothetical protein